MKNPKPAAKPKEAGHEKVAIPYEPTENERVTTNAYLDRIAEKPPRRIKVTNRNGGAAIEPDHPEPKIGHLLLMEALGITDADFYAGLLKQLTNAGSHGPEPEEEGVNFMLSVIKGVEPKDQVEAMLAAQMAAVHMATMTFARRLAHVETFQQQDSAERGFNKLARTFTTQVEALKRYRSGGEQNVTVKYVTVNSGGAGDRRKRLS